MDEVALNDLSTNETPPPTDDGHHSARSSLDSEAPSDAPLVTDEDEQKDVPWTSLFAFTTGRHKIVLGAALTLSIISGLVIPGMSILMGKIFGAFAQFGSGTLSPDEFMDEVKKYSLWLTILGCGSWILNGAFFAMWLWFGELQAKSARDKLFDSLISKDLSWFEERKTGVSAMITGSQTYIKALQLAVSQPLGFATQELVTATAAVGVAFYHSWSLTLVILALIPVALALIAYLSSKIQPHIDGQKKYLAVASKTASSAIIWIETVKASNGQAQEHGSFVKAVGWASKEYRKQSHLNGLRMGFTRILILGMFVEGFWYGNKLVRGGSQFSPGDIMTTFWSCLMATQALETVMPQVMVLEKGRAAGAWLKALLTTMENKTGSGRRQLGGRMPMTCSGDIELTGVSFTYPSRPSELVLTDVNLRLPTNETTFIVGHSGSGKSTVASLVIGAHHPLAGDISIDGNSIKTLDPRWIRDNISVVQAQSPLFNESVFRNISFGRGDYENVTKEDVLDACRAMALEKTILDLPCGLDTIVGAGGKQLSGGQMQRVALARDRLRDATILILDEALSALDVSNRRIVMETIREWRKGKTTIIITHDICEIGPDDFTYVMERGKVVQEGHRRNLETEVGPFQMFLDASGVGRPGSGNTVEDGDRITGYDGPYANNLLKEIGAQDRITRHDGPFADEVPKEIGSPEVSIVRDKRFSEVMTLTDFPFISAVTPSARPISQIFLNFSTVGEGSNPPKPITDEERALPKRAISRVQQGKPTLRQIFATVWPALSTKGKFLLVLGFVAAFFHAASTPVFAFALARLLQSILDTRIPESTARNWALSIIGVAFADGLNYYLMFYLLEFSGQSWADHHRIRAFSRVLDQPLAWFSRDENSVANLIEDLEKHVEEMRNIVGRFAGLTFVGVSLMVICMTWSLISSWHLTLVGSSIAPVMYGISRGMAWMSGHYENRCNNAAQMTGGILYEAITNIRAVRNYNIERFFRKKYFDATKTGLALGIRRSFWEGFWFGLSDSSMLFATALIFYYGAHLMFKSNESLSDVLSVFTLLLFSTANANVIIGMIPQISNSKDSAHRVLRLSTLPHDSHEQSGTLSFPILPAAITFKSVVFSYPARPHIPVLRGLSLTIPAGQCIAIVGSSGSGKSTLVALLQRLYTPNDGEILIGRHPLTTLSTRLLRQRLAIIPQQPTLWDISVADNITYGLPAGEVGSEDVVRAAKLAGIHEFVESLPEGYNTLLSAGGGGLSAGQAQRVAISRALVRRPRVLILDECTANLDSESAKTIKENVVRLLREEQGRMTVLMITHAEELMRVAQRVVVVGEGKIVEEGTYAELKALGGEFSRLLE